MSLAFTNNMGQVVDITEPDQKLIDAYHKVKRFQITNMKDLKGLIINVRDMLAFPTAAVTIYKLSGKPEKIFLYPNERVFGFKKVTALMENGQNWFLPAKPRRVFVDDLIKHNISFKYNSKVRAFIELLNKADKFQQHCLINGKPYTEVSFQHFTWLNYDHFVISSFRNDPKHHD